MRVVILASLFSLIFADCHYEEGGDSEPCTPDNEAPSGDHHSLYNRLNTPRRQQNWASGDYDWERHYETLHTVTCPLLPFDLSQAEYPSGTTITINCPNGYLFVPSKVAMSSSTCQSDGAWSVAQFGVCKKIVTINYCSDPEQVENSQIVESLIVKVENADSHKTIVFQGSARTKRHTYNVVEGKTPSVYTIGSFVRYACNHGYRMQGSTDQSFCRYPHWSQPPSCHRVCFAPDTPAHAIIDRQLTSEDAFEFPVNGYITYKCVDSNFDMIGPSKIICLSDGTWSDLVPACKSRPIPLVRIVECNTPTIPPNVNVFAKVIGRSFDRHPIGGYIRFECADGFDFVAGSKIVITCQSDGTWDYPPPRCSRVYTPVTMPPFECSAPQVPANAYIVRQFASVSINHRYPVGGFIEYDCHDHYEMVGQRMLNCNFTGWSSSPPTCIRTCVEPDFDGIPNHVVVKRPQMKSSAGNYMPGSAILFDCTAGFHLSNVSLSMTCQSNGRWNPMHVKPTCISKYEPVDMTRTVCGHPPTMKSAYIIKKSEPPHNNRYRLGTVVMYECNVNHSMVGNGTYECQSNGFWLPVGTQFESYCEVTCSSPKTNAFSRAVDVSKYIAETQRYRHGAHIRYSCFNGATMSGHGTLWCHQTGQWSSPPPTCTLPCGTPRTPSNAKVMYHSPAMLPLPLDDFGNVIEEKRKFEPGAKFQFECTDGYNQIDPELGTVFCRNGGYWLTLENKDIGEICLFFPNWMAQK